MAIAITVICMAVIAFAQFREGLFNAVVNFALLLLVNQTAKALGQTGLW